MVTRAVKNNTFQFWWIDIKFYMALGLTVAICLALGFTAGAIHTKKQFDQAAIGSGHAQYHPTKGSIEWRECR